MQKQITKLPKSIAEVSITVPWNEMQEMWNQVVSQVQQNLEYPGFRKGQVPLEMVEQRAGSQVQQEFLKQIMPQSLMNALEGTDVVPIDFPQYQIVSFTKGGDLVFKARITMRPEVKVGDYKALKVARPAVKQVEEAEVDKIVEDLFNRWKARTPGQTPITPGNEPINTASAPEAATGSNQPGGSLAFNAPPPAPVAATDPKPLSNQPDDNFAQAMGAANLVDLRTKIKTDLESEAQYNNELDYEEAILQEVEKITTVEVPDILVSDELNRMLVSLQRRVADMGLLLEDYLRGQNKTMEQLRKEWLPQAEKNVRMELGLAEIARLENVVVFDEELQAEIDKIQDSRVKQQFEAQEPKMHLRHALRQTRTLNLMKDFVKAA